MHEPTDIPIRVLGPVRVGNPGMTLRPKQALLLGALALRGGRVPTDELMALLWGDERPENPKAALQVNISRLRRALDGIGASLQYQPDGYRLVADHRQVDVACFKRLVREGTATLATDPSRARELLAAALDLWTDRPLQGAADDTHLQVDVERLEDSRLTALETRIDADLALGRHTEVVAELRQVTRAEPFHEGFRRQLLLALYRSGRASEALAAYEEARMFVADELGADPAPALRDVHTRILEQDPTLMDTGLATVRRGREREAVDPASVAVLPFEVIGHEPDAILLAAGLHVDLLTELSRVEGLTVTSRHSVLQYDPAEASPLEVAGELGVATVLVGSIRTAGPRFRLSVQLVDAAAGAHRWAESYDHELTPHDILAVQQDLASDIAGTLSLRLARNAPAVTTGSMEAYRLVAEGRMQFDRKTEEGLARAVDQFRRAVLVDAGFGPAWTGLAAALAMTADYGYGDRRSLLQEAEAAVVRAQALVPQTAEAHEALGLIAEAQFDAPRALAEYEAAIRIAPGSADAHSWRAWINLTLGDAVQAHASARRAVALNPLSAEAVSNLALSLTAVGDPEQGLAEARRADELSPGYTTAAYYMGLALYDLGCFTEAREVLDPLAIGAPGQLTVPWAGMAPDAALAITQVALGDAAAATATSATIDPTTHPVEAGLVAAALGDIDRAHEHFAAPSPVGYGGAMLRHHHFRDVWGRLGEDPRLHDLDRHIARSWSARPRRTSADGGTGPG